MPSSQMTSPTTTKARRYKTSPAPEAAPRLSAACVREGDGTARASLNPVFEAYLSGDANVQGSSGPANGRQSDAAETTHGLCAVNLGETQMC